MKRTRKAKPAPTWVPDAASSKEASRTRIALIAAERGLANAETAFAGRLATGDFISFSMRHNISMDWLLCGDLKGLLRTVRARRSAA